MISKKLIIKQFSILGFTEGLVDMIGNQGNHDEKFIELWKKVKQTSCILGNELRREATLNKKDIKTIRDQITELSEKHMDDGKFTAMFACSFCIDLLVEQIALTHTRKKNAFISLFKAMEEIDKYFDPEKEYDDDSGFNMAEDYRKMIGK